MPVAIDIITESTWCAAADVAGHCDVEVGDHCTQDRRQISRQMRLTSVCILATSDVPFQDLEAEEGSKNRSREPRYYDPHTPVR